MCMNMKNNMISNNDNTYSPDTVLYMTTYDQCNHII